MNTELIKRHTIRQDQLLKKALEMLNNVPENLTLFVVNNNDQLIGSLTDGDIRRGLLNGLSVADNVEQFMHRQFKFLRRNDFTLDQIRELRTRRIELVPMVDNHMHIVRLVDLIKCKSILPLDVIIMAGGKGERLKPLTNNVPKPMLRIGEKPILEHNLLHLAEYGIDCVHISVNYLRHAIKDYFGNGSRFGMNIKYIEENVPLGTLGSAALAEDIRYNHVLVMNADILTNIDFEDFFDEFIQSNAFMSIASVPYKVNMPFAVLETAENRVLSFSEKPEYTYYTNAGIYLLKKELLGRIPSQSVYHATDLMQDIINRNEKLTQYSIRGFWMDIGRKEDFEKAQTEIKHLYSK